MGKPVDPSILAALKREIQALGGLPTPKEVVGPNPKLKFLHAHLPQQVFPQAAVHEFRCTQPESWAASAAFILSLIHTCFPKPFPLVWIAFEQPVFPPAFSTFGIQASEVVLIHPTHVNEARWSLLETLRTPGIQAVVANWAQLDMTTSRQLQLATEASGVTAFLLNTNRRAPQHNACFSRWTVHPAPSLIPDELPGVGFPTWDIRLQKMRHGLPGRWTIAWTPTGFTTEHDLRQSRTVTPISTPLRKIG